jgi:ATP phosphoribosyltransferase regulatory subunit
MNDAPPHRIPPGLLPAGFTDLLPPEAEHEAALVEALMESFARHGYERVKPPLLEFEESLLAGSGAAVADQTFRLMDPVSQRMMGLRADTTPQVSRIAATRLGAAARPLRLCYAGQVLRVRGSELSPERQLPQAGIELIGGAAPEADAEVALVAAEALVHAGIGDVTLDVTLPRLAHALIEAASIEEPLASRLARALDRKDVAAVAALVAGRGRGRGAAAETARRGGSGSGGARRARRRAPARGGAFHRRQRGQRGPCHHPAGRALARDARSGRVPRLPLPCGRRLHPLRTWPDG